MNSREFKVERFHTAFEHPVNEPLDHQRPDKDLWKLRARLVQEEATELQQAITKYIQDGGVENYQHLLKELADLQYVLSGVAVTFGLPLEEVFTEVHNSNMSKLGPNGEVLRRDDGKILKGENYRAPNLSRFI